MPGTPMKAYEAVVDRLVAASVDTVFGLASEEIIALLSEMEDNRPDDLRVVHCRHEQGAAAMADGYARFSGGIGVCVVGRGPAIAQTGTALVSASKAGSRVLYLVPETRRTVAYDGKGFSQTTFLETMVGTVDSVRTPAVLSERIDDAVRRLRAGEGPIALQVPIDVLEAEVPGDAVAAGEAEVDEAAGLGQSPMEPAPDALEAVVDAYLDADATEPPVVLAGRGAVRAGAKDAIEALAERMGAYLVTTLQAMGYFADHPYGLGFAGDLGAPLANEYLAETGFLLALGCGLNHHTVDEGHLVRSDAKVVHVDTDPDAIGRFTPVDVGVVADARATATALEAELAEFGIDRADEFWTEPVAEEVAASTPVTDRAFEETPGTADPRDVVAALDDALPAGRLVVVDVGHFAGFLFDGLTLEPTDDLHWTTDFLSLGQALPFGTGAALAEDDRTPIVVCGDGGFLMILQELETAAREGVPMIVVVLNDDALGAEYHMGQLRGFSGDVGKVPAPDLGAVASDLGADGHTLRSAEEVEAMADALTGALDGPLVLDCRVNPNATHRSMGNLSIE